uniref:Putative neural proliferation differentiation and control protein n=1 Tax=Corethrella appendiculata TaxID=1370023 RepID=U5EQ86_9DIPT
MNWIIYGLSIFCCLITKVVVAENEYFPGLRRPPNQLSSIQWPSNDLREAAREELLKKINILIEEQARRRFFDHVQQQQRYQQQQQQAQQNEIFRGPHTSQIINEPEFSYQLPFKNNLDTNEPIIFAVDPSDARFYDAINPNQGVETLSGNNNKLETLISQEINKIKNNNKNSKNIDDYDGAILTDDDNLNNDKLIGRIMTQDPVPYYKLKAPMHVNPKIVHENDAISEHVDDADQHHSYKSGVVQKPLEMEGIMGMYIIALIAGISAAVTVGLISVGIGWYTLHKKAKLAADVEYPAYGITGPNKDISPSGDRKLAQSAQMFHYQHQKQQIIAMENHSNGEKNGTLSDVESDDENEEGDYTVYECPGLAPTGEMEVKNPLFLDDPTPATPANLQQQQKQQQHQHQQSQDKKLATKPDTTKKVNEKKK